MANYITCPNRDSQKVNIAICLRKCELKHECDALKSIPREALVEIAKRLKLPAKSLAELETVIEVEVEPENGNGQLLHEIGKSVAINCTFPQPVEISDPNQAKTQRAMALYEKALFLKIEIHVRFIEMGGVLNEIYDNQYYKQCGYGDWKEFCNEALDIKWRMALYLRAIYLKKDRLKLSDQECAEVGVTKLIQILPVMTDRRSAEKWINEAKKPGVTTEKLLAKVRHARGISKDEAEKVPVKYVLPVYEDDIETVERAFELAKEIIGSDSRGVQFVGICDGFRAEYEHESGDFDKKRIITGMIKRTEELFKIRFGQVTDLETDEIIVEG